MIKNIKYIPIILILLTLQSCGLFNKVFKKSSKYKENLEVVTSKEDITNIIDKSKITIKESKDTTLYTKAKTSKVETPVTKLKDINNVVLLDNDQLSIRQDYDSIRNILSTIVDLKPQPIDFKYDKTTIIDKDVNTKVESKKDSTFKKSVVDKKFEKTKEPINILYYVLAAIAVIGVGYFITKKYFKL